MLRLVGWIVVALTLAGCVARTEPAADAETIAAVSYRDPGPATFTLYTMVNNRNGQGAHTSLMINASKERIIFDPAGSFRADIVPERGDVLFGITPAVEQAYRSSHARSTYHVLVQTIEVTAEQADIAYQLALSNGRVPGGFCAKSTINILNQVPGFEGIKSTFYPVKFAEQFGKLPGVVSTRYYEDDSDDLQDGLARNNAILNQ
jgi:hypothetical protein